MNRPARRLRVGRALSLVALLAALVTCALLFGVTSWWQPVPAPVVKDGQRAAPSPTAAPGEALTSRAAGSTYTVMQMNLCLSGVADCYGATAYPAVVEEAISRIQESRPDAVTLNEACRRDGVQIARQTGYHVRFAWVVYAGGPFSCVDPGGRGLFGHAVLTKAPVARSESAAFTAQAELEERRWLCVTTRVRLDVCTAHLETPHTRIAAAASDAQCAELAAVLAARASRVLVFGGDLNRRASCAPADTWSRTDTSARQAPGVQHIYGSAALGSPETEVLPSLFSDHDVLLVRARLQPR